MNSKTKQFVFGMAVSVGIAFSYAVPAHDRGKASAGYVGDSSGYQVTDGMGKCVIDSAWTKELAVVQCHPSMAPKKAMAEPAPKPAPVAAPAPKPTPVVEKVTLKAGALFDSSKAALKPAGLRELDELAAKLKGVQGIDSIQVIGHTDSRGQASLNQKLSEQRAEVVKSYLESKGVDGQLISTHGMGASSPVASNATLEGRAQNRRVELEIKARK